MSSPDLQQSPVGHTGATIESPFDRVADAATRHERWLWGVVVVALIGDVLLTNVGLGQGMREGNPAMRWAIGAGGIGALVLVKVSAVAVGVSIRLWRPQYAGSITLGLAVPWLLAVAINAVVIS
jgi:hypothetical protein